MFGQMLAGARGMGIALRRGERAAHQFHYARVGIEVAISRQIIIPPWAQQQPGRGGRRI